MNLNAEHNISDVALLYAQNHRDKTLDELSVFYHRGMIDIDIYWEAVGKLKNIRIKNKYIICKLEKGKLHGEVILVKENKILYFNYGKDITEHLK